MEAFECPQAAISACGKGSQPSLAEDLLEQMRSDALEPDAISYGAAMGAMASQGLWERALHFFDDMALQLLESNLVSYGCLVAWDSSIRETCSSSPKRI